MAVVKMRPPVQAQGVDMGEIEELAGALSDLEPGEFVGTGEEFPSEVSQVKDKNGKFLKNEDGTPRMTDKGRSKANAQAAKIIRVIESRFNVTLRSRTWQTASGSWTFGIRPKDSTEAPNGDQPADE